MPKKQAPKRKGQWEVQESLAKSSTFITLKLGKSACERFLSTRDPATLRWIKKNTVLVTQRHIIEQQYLDDEPEEPANVEDALSHGDSPDVVHVPPVPPALPQISAASHGETTDDSDRRRGANNKVSAISSTSTIKPEVDGKGHTTFRYTLIMEPPPPRPKLKLSFSQMGAASPNNIQTQTQSQPQTPSTQQVRTPSIKLNFGKAKPAPSASGPPTASEDGPTPTGSSKKRKRKTPSVEPEPAPVAKARAPQLLKLITKQAPSTAKNSAITPGIKLKTKGKIPKRPTGVGYDSELEDREIDPVILEAFVLRMLPGDDCNYIRDAIANGTVGVSILQKGADIRMRVLDVNGRRGILQIRGKQYAFTIVDLPTITEGMKSWDRKNFIKSVDISQMCLVLGPCKDDEEARTYPLPPDVNPKNYQYAHGLTAPMRNVRKRRFERTARTRLDDIESIERKVNSLLEADSKAHNVTYEVLDHDPRAEEDEFSEEYDSDEDAEGEEEVDYFPQNGAVETQAEYSQTPEEQFQPDEISALEAMFEQGVDENDYAPDTAEPSTAAPSLQPGSANPLSSSAPSVAGETPSAVTDTPAHAAADDDDDEGPDDDEASEADQEADDEQKETMAKIREAEDKIARQKEQLKGTSNQILKKKIAKKIQDLDSDIRMMRRHIGKGEEEEEEEGGGEGAQVQGEEGGGGQGGEESGSGSEEE
ncbi:hypothetical protein PMZ80_006641 [Knufia obscura]|uniref:TAFII55 protein conserved region domain-containing protein n=2 Tax=Knufia TaxID=430999 RepID=A0AAN8EJM0_9EURO|nr:hypothetical protein PMZ80_006641 [Knufia obscura]KAK5951000.1 hypothetical protein OHC33_008072 [Knufia fluminis]